MIQSKELICFGVLQIFISNFCLLPKIQDSIRKLTCRKHSTLNLLLIYICQRLISQYKKGITLSIGQVKEDINDVIEEDNDDEVNVAKDNKIKHETLRIFSILFPGG